jgi:hypothetical protein
MSPKTVHEGPRTMKYVYFESNKHAIKEELITRRMSYCPI